MDLINFERPYELAEKMLSSALNNDWDELNKHQLLQNTLIQELFRMKKEFSEVEIQELKKIVNILEETIDIAEKNKSEINHELLRLRKSMEMQKAYSENSC